MQTEASEARETVFTTCKQDAGIKKPGVRNGQRGRDSSAETNGP